MTTDRPPIDLDDPTIAAAVAAAANAAPPLPPDAIALLSANNLPVLKKAKRSKKAA